MTVVVSTLKGTTTLAMRNGNLTTYLRNLTGGTVTPVRQMSVKKSIGTVTAHDPNTNPAKIAKQRQTRLNPVGSGNTRCIAPSERGTVTAKYRMMLLDCRCGFSTLTTTTANPTAKAVIPTASPYGQ